MTLLVTVLKDNLPEDDESFTVKIFNPSNGAAILSTKDSLEVVIMANDNAFGRVGFANSSLYVTAVERSHDVAIHLDLNREFGLNRDLVVGYSVVSVTSQTGHEVTKEIYPASGKLKILSGHSKATLTVYLLADDVPEIVERFEVR